MICGIDGGDRTIYIPPEFHKVETTLSTNLLAILSPNFE